MANTPTNSTRSRRSSKGRSAGTHATETALPPASIALPSAAEQRLPERVAASFVARSGGFNEAPNRRAMIAEAAYFRAEARGFAPGHEEEDWLAAERQVDAVLARVADGALSLRTMGDAELRGPPN